MLNNRVAKSVSIAIVAIMALAVIPAARLLPSIRLQNDLETWLSANDERVVALRQLELYFPKKERILISWDSSWRNDPRLDAFRDRIEKSRFFAEVDTAKDLVEQIVRWKVDEDEAVRRLSGVLIGPSSQGEPPVSVLLALSEQGMSDVAAVLEVIASTAADCGVDADELRVEGELVTSHAIDREVRDATWNFVDPWQRPPVFAISALAGVILAFFVLRSVRLGIMIAASAWFTSLVTTSLLPGLGRPMNMVTIVMPTLMVVLTISAAIHVANYWKRAVVAGDAHPIRAAVRMSWRPCLLASATTGVGLLSLTISRLSPIRDFGWFSTIGVMLSFVVVITGFPAMLRLWPIRSVARTREFTGWPRLANFICRHQTAIVIGGAVLGVTMAFGLRWLKTEVKVIRYFPEDSRLIQDVQFFENTIGGIISLDILVHFDEHDDQESLFLERMEFIRDIEESIRQHPDITGTVSLADFQPVTPRPGREQSTLARLKYRTRNRRTESSIKTRQVASSAQYLAVSNDPGYVWTQDDPLDETWRIGAQTLLTGDLDYGRLAQELETIVGDKTRDSAGVWISVTGSVPVFYQAQTALLESLIRSLGLAFVVISGVMMLLLRGIRAGLLSILPGTLPIVVVFGLLSWSGQVLDIGTMLTGSVALGIAVDNMLHLLTWFRAAIREGRSRSAAVSHALSHCGPAMTQTTLVIGLSLLLLYPAELLLISRFGWVMASLLGTAWLSEVVLLPALLAGSLGRLIENVELAAGATPPSDGRPSATRTIHSPHDRAVRDLRKSPVRP